MNVSRPWYALPQSIATYCDATQQATLSVMTKIRDFRNNPELFQKICQVTGAVLQLIIIHHPERDHLKRLWATVSAAGMHDFYSGLKLPVWGLFHVSAECIDENKVLKSLIEILMKQVPDIGNTKEEREKGLHQKAKEYLQSQLKDMTEQSYVYRNVEEFKGVLARRLKDSEDPEYDFTTVDLAGLDVPLRHVPLLERIANFNWAIVDIGCIGFYFHAWNLLDTAKWAEKIGQYQGFQWVRHSSLEHWVVGLLTTAFALKLVEAVRKLRDEVLTQQEIRQARWNAITSCAEVILFSSVYLNLMGLTKFNTIHIQCLTILAKSLGILSIVTKPKHQLFQMPSSAAA